MQFLPVVKFTDGLCWYLHRRNSVISVLICTGVQAVNPCTSSFCGLPKCNLPKSLGKWQFCNCTIYDTSGHKWSSRDAESRQNLWDAVQRCHKELILQRDECREGDVVSSQTTHGCANTSQLTQENQEGEVPEEKCGLLKVNHRKNPSRI